MSKFQKAAKRLAKLKIAITGPSGSGKTYSSLILAKGLGGKVAVIDTENNSACLYADRFGDFTYDVMNITPPYTAQKYIQAINDAITEGYNTVVIDSFSHVWAAEGGLLDQKSAKDSRGGNSYTNWAEITKLHEMIKSKVLFSDIHVIATMRSKQEYVMETNEKGKQQPKKVGLAPIQRDGMEYEFTVVFDVGMDHQFMVSKDRTALFDGVVEPVSEKTAHQLNEWLAGADRTHWVPPQPEPLPPPPKPQPRQAAQPKPAQLPNHAPGSEPLRVDAKGEPYFHPGDYIVRIKSKALGDKMLKDCSVDEIKKTIEWIGSSAKKPLAASLSEFLNYASQYLATVPKSPVVPPPFDHDEQIPDFDSMTPDEIDRALASENDSHLQVGAAP